MLEAMAILLHLLFSFLVLSFGRGGDGGSNMMPQPIPTQAPNMRPYVSFDHANYFAVNICLLSVPHYISVSEAKKKLSKTLL